MRLEIYKQMRLETMIKYNNGLIEASELGKQLLHLTAAYRNANKPVKENIASDHHTREEIIKRNKLHFRLYKKYTSKGLMIKEIAPILGITPQALSNKKCRWLKQGLI